MARIARLPCVLLMAAAPPWRRDRSCPVVPPSAPRWHTRRPGHAGATVTAYSKKAQRPHQLWTRETLQRAKLERIAEGSNAGKQPSNTLERPSNGSQASLSSRYTNRPVMPPGGQVMEPNNDWPLDPVSAAALVIRIVDDIDSAVKSSATCCSPTCCAQPGEASTPRTSRRSFAQEDPLARRTGCRRAAGAGRVGEHDGGATRARR